MTHTHVYPEQYEFSGLEIFEVKMANSLNMNVVHIQVQRVKRQIYCCIFTSQCLRFTKSLVSTITRLITIQHPLDTTLIQRSGKIDRTTVTQPTVTPSTHILAVVSQHALLRYGGSQRHARYCNCGTVCMVTRSPVTSILSIIIYQSAIFKKSVSCQTITAINYP